GTAGSACSRTTTGSCRPDEREAPPDRAEPLHLRSRLAFEPPRHRIELIEIAVVDVHHALLAAMVDHDLQAERIGDPLLERDGVGVLAGARPAALRLTSPFVLVRALTRPFLDLPDVQPALDDLQRELLGVGFADQHAGMSGGQLAGADMSLHRVGQAEQA